MSHNLYYDTAQDGDSTGTKTVCTSNCAIFTSIANKDFSLKTAVGGGMSLPSPFNIDPNGVTRGGDSAWDRGAYEFGSSGVVVIQPPTNLVVQ